MKFVILAALMALGLTACEFPKTQLICSVDGNRVFTSNPSDGIWKAEKADYWIIEGQGNYQPPANSVCGRYQVN